MGLHKRYTDLVGSKLPSITLSQDSRIDGAKLKELRRKFSQMMSALFKENGAELRIEILADPEVEGFIETHSEILSSPLEDVDISETMKARLLESNYIFSGIKTFHELNEAFPSLLDKEGKRKPFEQFLNDVRSIDETYNHHYLHAEYNFAQASAEMAGKWERFTEDGDDYLLQYRTANDSKVRPEHAELHGVTLPADDSFWDEYFPPNGWNCRCTVIQVLKSRFEETPHSEAMQRAEQALQQDKKGMFHFNPGKTGKSFPDYNPYTLRRCNSCDVAKGELKLAYQFANDNQLCQACQFLRRMRGEEPFRRLDGNERKQIHDSALAWADRHLPKVPMPDGTEGARLTVKTADGYELHIGKKFFNETFSKCKNSRRVAKTMEIATHIDEWIKDAIHVDTEPGKHHKFDFEVFRSNYNGQEIEFKAKVTEGLIVYLMRLL